MQFRFLFRGFQGVALVGLVSMTSCARVPEDQLRSDLERLVGKAVEITRFKRISEKKLGEFGGRGECFDGGVLAEFSIDVRARAGITLRNFRTEPDFDELIRQLEGGRTQVPPARLEILGAMFRLAEMSPPEWKSIAPGGTVSFEATFEYLQKCGQKELRFERALPGHKTSR